MGHLYARQPNGLYCQVSNIVNAFTNFDMTADDLKKALIHDDYKHCNDESGHMSEKAEEKLNQDLNSPDGTGYFLKSFKACMDEIELCNYKDIDELRNILKIIGVRNWETFMTLDYAGMKARIETFNDCFSEKREIIVNYLIDEYANERHIAEYKIGYATEMQMKADIKSIRSVDDYIQLARKYYFPDIDTLVKNHPTIDDIVDYDVTQNEYQAQFENV